MTDSHNSTPSPNQTLDVVANQGRVICQVGVREASFIATGETWDVNLEAGCLKSRGELAIAGRSVKGATNDDKSSGVQALLFISSEDRNANKLHLARRNSRE